MTWTLAPVLRVRDVRASVRYYREKLGFECPEESIIEGIGSEGAIYAIVRREGIMIHLGRARTGHEIDPGRPPNALGAYLYVSDAKALHGELLNRGADVVEHLA
jgi:catechol 2,3-dioxygenase-like lactoylglutathione lyase family enzyme